MVCWYPVIVEDHLVWLEYVERKFTYSGKWYRFIDENMGE